MNKAAEKHLATARDYVARGEEFYRRAADEVVAAREADDTLGYREIAARLGKGKTWVEDLVNWRTSGREADTPFSGDTPANLRSQQSATRKTLRESTPEQLREIMDTLPVERRAEVVRAAVPPPDRTSTERSGPSFIDLLVRVNTALIELEAMVASWQNPAAVPAEFSRESFGDVVQKALRIQDKFDELVAAIDNEDEDEFQKIVRNFRVTSDVG